jgi:hypothetical protein
LDPEKTGALKVVLEAAAARTEPASKKAVGAIA